MVNENMLNLGKYGNTIYFMLLIVFIFLLILLIYLIISRKRLQVELDKILKGKNHIYNERLVFLKARSKMFSSERFLEQFVKMVRDYFKETLNLGEEFTYEELSQNLIKKKKSRFAKFVSKLSISYSNEKIEKEKILNLIDEFLELLEKAETEGKPKMIIKPISPEVIRWKPTELKIIGEKQLEIEPELISKVKFIAKIALQKGYSKEQIKKLMMKKRWPSEICDKILKSV